MAQVVAERDRLGQVLVQTERAGGRPRDLRDLQGVGEADPVVVAFGGQEHLRLVLQAAEGLRVDDSVSIPLETGSKGVALPSRSRPLDSADRVACGARVWRSTS